MDYEIAAEELLATVLSRHTAPVPSKLNEAACGECGVLARLHYTGDGASSGELGRELGISTGRIAIILGTLEKKGLAVRRSDPDDRRVKRVYITEDGRALVASLMRELRAHLKALLSFLGEEDAAALLRIVEKMTDFCRLEKQRAQQEV